MASKEVKCPVCGKGAEEWSSDGAHVRLVPHLDCVQQLEDGRKQMVDSNERLLKRAEQAEADLAALKAKYEWVEYWFANLFPVDWDRCMKKWEARP